MKSTLSFILVILTIVFSPPVLSAENTIYLQNDQIAICPPSTWIIIAHKLDSSKDVVAFQIKNPADEGSQDSANISVVAYDLKDTGNMIEFTGKVLGHENQKHVESEMGEWAINTFSDKQGETTYEIRDCYRTIEPCGLHVRLAFPKLAKTTKEWTDRLETQFKEFLRSIESKATK